MTYSRPLSIAFRLSFLRAAFLNAAFLRAVFLNAALPSAVLFSAALLSIGCATSKSSSPDAEAPDAKPAEEEQVQIAEEAPEVTHCHTETQSCDLTEPLPPGAGCFCPGEGGAQEAGTAGG